MNKPGGWVITEEAKNCPTCNLPEQVATAFSKVTMDLMVGAKYEPLMYLATQVVNGTNYMILCRETISDNDHTVLVSAMVLNIPTSGDPHIVLNNPLF